MSYRRLERRSRERKRDRVKRSFKWLMVTGVFSVALTINLDIAIDVNKTIEQVEGWIGEEEVVEKKEVEKV